MAMHGRIMQRSSHQLAPFCIHVSPVGNREIHLLQITRLRRLDECTIRLWIRTGAEAKCKPSGTNYSLQFGQHGNLGDWITNNQPGFLWGKDKGEPIYA